MFRIQEAFREKLDKWPKVGPKDGRALQAYADTFRSCLDAKPHIKGLSVLDDYKENQKMTAKLPDWVITRWSRVVSESLDNSAEYPPFERFVSFVEKEARVACNPVVSLSAVKTLGTSTVVTLILKRTKGGNRLAALPLTKLNLPTECRRLSTRPMMTENCAHTARVIITSPTVGRLQP